MASSINASTTAGVVTTADTSGVLNIQTAGVTAISIDASQAVSFTNSPTVTGGTANGVAYLNGSKVLTTGSALTWDGSLLSTTVADNTVGVKFKATTSNIRFLPQDGGAAKIAALNAAESAFYPLITQGSSLQYVIDTTEGMRLTSTGLGIGTTSPYKSITVGASDAAAWITAGGANTNLTISSVGANGSVIFRTGGTNSQPDTTTERARIDSSGNLLVGAGTATTRISAGSGQFSTSSGMYIFSGSLSDNSFLSRASAGSGTTTWYIGNQSITTSSDIRLKENIVDTQRNALEILGQLRVVDHTWNDPSDQCENNRNSRGTWMGLIAQEAQPVIPWLVNKPTADVDENGDPQYWHMDYGYSVPLLVKAIQEMKALIDTQASTITQLQADVAALKGATP